MKGVKLGYGILLLLTLLVAVVNNAYQVFLLLAAELLLPVFLFLYLFYCRHCLKVRLFGERHWYRQGEKVPLFLELGNSGIFPIINGQIAIRCINRYLPSGDDVVVVASAGAGKTQLVELYLTSEHCGQLDIGLSAVTIFDPLSLWQTKAELNPQHRPETSILVFPVFYEEKTWPDLSLTAAAGTEDVYSLHKSGDDPSEVFAVREYRPGDRQRQIHWKLSFKQGYLMVREFSLPIYDRLIIFVDFNVQSFAEDVLSLTDKMLETVLSLSYYLQGNCVRHSIAWFDERRQNMDSINIDGEDDIYSAMQHLFSVPLYEGESGGRRLRAGLGETSSPHIIYFAPGALPEVLNGERRAV